ncbi:hypothetical protein [Methylomonas sp. YC3]
MKENYADYFTRIQDAISTEAKKRVNWPIFERDRTTGDEKLIDLFLDCFDHHTQWSDRQPVDHFTLLTRNARRYIPRDEILVRFIDKHYVPPAILKSPYTDAPYKPEDFISYDKLCADIQSNPITDSPENSVELGSNTYTYIVGDVGVGKSLFVISLFRQIAFAGKKVPYQVQDEGGYIVVPVYVNVDDKLEDNGNLRPIDDAWFEKNIIDLITTRLRSNPTLETISELGRFIDPVDTGFVNRIRKLTQHLARRKLRLVLLVDNVDRYHFHYSKYRFSTKYKYLQREAVVRNLKYLISCLTSRNELGWCGLCVVIICRDYVHEYLRAGCNDHSEKDREFGRAHKLVLQDDQEVLQARLRLFDEALSVIPQEWIGKTKNAYLTALQSLLANQDAGERLRPEIELILRLGNHGYRSLVEFIDRLEFDLADTEVFERLLMRQSKNLPSLYLLNLKRRYSQRVGHFPNLFLVDARAAVPDEFAMAHPEHRPTYWLKYFILKVIAKNKSRRIEQLLRLFSTIGDYDEDLVRLVVGSLCSTNDSRCIDVDASGEILRSEPDLYVTPRGHQLISRSDAFGEARVEFCFEFNYLQLVVDDLWLSIPNDLITSIASEYDYAYLIKRGDEYSKYASLMVTTKAKSVIAFAAILASSLRTEMKHMPRLREYLKKNELLPDMNRIQETLLDTCTGLYRRVSKSDDTEIAELKKYFDQCASKAESLDAFFDNVQKKGVTVL